MTEPHKAAKPMIWYKDKKGTTYLCDKEKVGDVKHLGKKEIERACVDESQNPQT